MRLYRPSLALAFFVGACAGSSGCSSEGDAPPAASTPEEKEALLQSKLEADTGVGWKVIVERGSNEVRFLSPNVATANATKGASPEEMARVFFERYAADLGMTEAEQLRAATATTDSYGLESVRFEHALAGSDLPIFDGSSLAEFTADGRLLHVQPGFHGDLSMVARVAAVSQSDAENAALAHARGTCRLGPNDAVERKTTTLGVSAEPNARAALAWAVDLRTTLGACVAPRIFVDATTGAVLAQRETAAFLKDRAGGVRFHALGETDDKKEIDVTPSFDILGKKWVMTTEGASPKVKTFTYAFLNLFNNPVESRKLGEWEVLSPFRGAAVDGHYYAGKALDYFKAVHHRNGLDGNGADLVVVVHDPEKQSLGRNAHYRDYGILFNDDQLHVGDGGAGWLPLSAAFDVMAHELAHGVTARSSKLVYRGESGALNEAFSDVMGAAAENWLPETRSPTKNVLIGERMTTDGRGLRNMADPSEDFGGGVVRSDVDHYKLMPPCTVPTDENDYCGVHSNSGIANRAFTLMTLGGVHKNSKVAVAKGIGWERARELWYNSFSKLGPTSNYAMAAFTQLAQAAATQDLEVLGAVACAWFAVGVLDPVDLRVRAVACVGSNPGGGPPPAVTSAPPPAPPAGSPVTGCKGRTSGYVCNDEPPNFANPCNAAATSVYCADPGQRCKKASPTDATASVSADGALECE
jgi:Zn-dependent metalloprotease